MKKKLFIFNAVTLTITALLTRTIGMAFRIYMSNKIGTEGMGLYQLILTVYLFTVTVSTSGICLAVTRIVTDALVKNNVSEAKHCTQKCLVISIILSSIIGIMLYTFSYDIGTYFLKDGRTILSLKVLSFSLPFMAVSACLRGYFYARRTVLKTASEQLIEQLIEILVFSVIIGVFAPKGLEYACCAISIGTTAAEILSCGYSYILYAIDKIKKEKSKTKSKGFVKNFLYIALPVTASSCLRSGLSAIENVFIPKGLRRYGSSSTQALSDYGLISGMVMPVISFPSVFLSSFSQLMIPEMSEANAEKHRNGINYMATRILHCAFIFSLLVMGIFIFFSDSLGVIIYNSKEAGFYIRVLAPIVPLAYMDSIVDGMLKGLNQQVHYLAYNIFDSVTRVILTLTLLPVWGIKGLVITMFTGTVINSGLSVIRLIKVANVKISVINWIIKPLLSVSTAGGIFFFLNSGIINNVAVISVEIIITVVLYYILLRVTKGIKKDDVLWVKKIITGK